MLFKKDGRSFEFCLLGLSDVEYTEIRALITENGGVLRDTGKPPAIQFSNHNRFAGIHPIFHVNYIRECVRRGELLQLIHFKFGDRGFYGCLMYIFTHGEYSCPCICDIDPRFSTTQIDLSGESSLSGNNEHNYVQEDCATDQESNTCSNDLNSQDFYKYDMKGIWWYYYNNEKILKKCSTTETINKKTSQNTTMPPAPLDSLPQHSQFLSDGSPQDSEFLPDESLSPINSVASENGMNTEVLGTRENDFALENPEAMRFKEQSCERNTCSPNQLNSENANQTIQTCPRKASGEMIMFPMQLGETKDVELSTQQAARSLNINELCPLSAAEEETEVCDDIRVSLERENEILLHDGLQGLRTSKQTTSNCSSSLIFKSGKIKRKSSTKNPVMKDQPVACGSRTAVSPTILRDESNQVKIFGGETRQALQSMKEFRLTSSDSDDTDYNPTTAIINREHSKSLDRSSSFRLKETNSKKKVLKKHRRMPGSTRESDDSDDAEKTEGIRDDDRIGGQSKSKKQSDKNNSTLCTRVSNTSWVSNNERSTMVTSTKSSDDVISISDFDSDTSSEAKVASSISRRAALCHSSPKKTSGQTISQNAVAKKDQTFRNFLPWEQREMIKYLIDKGCISEAKGNTVWKQMIEDGFLTHRTHLSLNNHFRKYILPHIHRFSMKRENMKKFRKLLQ